MSALLTRRGIDEIVAEEVNDHYLQAGKDSQRKHRQLIRECCAPLPISDVPFIEQEVIGIPMLKIMAEALYEGDDPTAIFFQGQVPVTLHDCYLLLG